MPDVRRTVVVTAPLARVVEVALDPRSWPAWWDVLGAVEDVDGDGGVGTTSGHRLLPDGGEPATVSCRVTENAADGPARHRWRAVVDGPVAGRVSVDLETVGAFDEEPAPEGALVAVGLVLDEPVPGGGEPDLDAALRRALGALRSLVET